MSEYLTPNDCEKRLLVRLKDGRWASLSNGKKVQADLLDPKFVESAVRLGHLIKIEDQIREIALQTSAFDLLKGHGLAFSFKNLEDLFDRAKFNAILMHFKRFGWEFNPIPSFFDKSIFCFRIGSAYVVIPNNTRNKQLVFLNKAYLQELFRHDSYLLSDEFFDDLKVEHVIWDGFAKILAAMVLNAQISGQDAFDEADKIGPLTLKILKEYFEGKYEHEK